MFLMTLISIGIFLMAVTFHEYAHGWMANRLGDPTARFLGRLTLNPIAHLDPIGSLALPLLLIFMRSPVVFGWAKPVPVEVRNLRNPKEDMIWVGLAGPGANLLLAFGLAILLRMGFGVFPFIRQLLFLGVLVNLILAFFNLVPIPPLDGSRILQGLLPWQYAYQYRKIEPYGIFIIFFLLAIGLFKGVILPMALELADFLTGTRVLF
jgi:Zn-dependent protease